MTTPNAMRDWDEDEGWIDSEEYTAYTEDVLRAITALGGTATMAQIKGYMCLLFDKDRFFDAAGTLEATGLLKRIKEVYPITWQLATPREMPELRYNGQPVAKGRICPDKEAFEGR
jgi:hypothetical protein